MFYPLTRGNERPHIKGGLRYPMEHYSPLYLNGATNYKTNNFQFHTKIAIAVGFLFRINERPLCTNALKGNTSYLMEHSLLLYINGGINCKRKICNFTLKYRYRCRFLNFVSLCYGICLCPHRYVVQKGSRGNDMERSLLLYLNGGTNYNAYNLRFTQKITTAVSFWIFYSFASYEL